MVHAPDRATAGLARRYSAHAWAPRVPHRTVMSWHPRIPPIAALPPGIRRGVYVTGIRTARTGKQKVSRKPAVYACRLSDEASGLGSFFRFTFFFHVYK
ncbi:hypothetical protein CBM2586_A10152 [Cupriavidus phytorum]|uniref:Uncharacterized protein n=1 Tax=Cupriavidus taiwanensis TaxID=164546 RepID=A0A975WP59_9BURK|nr:hypothetical protein CBM2586_A10152 [Cupriavidus taiwanensis]